MRKLLLLMLLGIIFCNVFSQENKTELDSTKNEINPKDLDKKIYALNLDEVRKKIGYPNAALKEGIEGIVLVKVRFKEDGNYDTHIVLKKVHSTLLEAVEAYLSELKFTPAKYKGKAIKYWVVVPFTFKLEDSVEWQLQKYINSK